MKKMIRPDQWPEGSPERTVAEFMLAWQTGNFDEMVKWTQQSWRSAMKEASGVLVGMFEHKRLERVFYLDRVDVPGLNHDVILDMKAMVEYRLARKDTRSRVHKKIITARVIREDAEGAPDPAGAWGVNPVSALRES